MQSIEDLLENVPALAGLDPAQRATVAGCARLRVFAPGDVLMREGAPAESFLLVRDGAVALQTAVPGRGPVTLETLHGGDLVGWSWLVPPYRTAFDVRATETTRAVSFDAVCLRGKCERDPALGFAMLKLLAVVFTQRLQDTRMRLLDLYAEVPGG